MLEQAAVTTRLSQGKTHSAPLNTEIAVRNFRHQPVKFRKSRRLATTSPRKRPDFVPLRLFQAGAALALVDGEHHVLRAALFSIVLTLAIGQNASLLCTVWCHDAASAGCPHQYSTTSPSVSADDNCSSVVVGAVGFVREDARRTAAAPAAQNALAVPHFRLAPSRTDVRPGFELDRRVLLEERPRVIAVRI